MKSFFNTRKINFLLITCFLFASTYMQARLGGGGGSSSGHSDGGGSDAISGLVWLIFRLLGFKGVLILGAIFLIYKWYSNRKQNNNPTQAPKNFTSNSFVNTPITTNLPFPEGLTSEKVKTAFLEMQNAWQNQDLSSVRKWMSDGLYQKLSVQIKMMEKLAQHNKMDNIRILNITVANLYSYNEFQIADVRIDFMLNDSFYSDKFKSMNETYNNDSAIEYYSFIKKGNRVPTESDLYSGNNCPNCGALISIDLGDICRCPNCKTLTNNPAYDWVLCEITQSENYNQEGQLNYDEELKEITKFDDDFNIQSLEDIASNVAMQILDVLTGGNNIKLERFAHADIREQILAIKENQFKNVAFDRLYLKEVTTLSFNKKGEDEMELNFYVEACGKRVRLENDNLKFIDNDFVTFDMNLSLLKGVLKAAPTTKDVVYSYECSNCGAPYDDTTHDTCNYCETVVVDESKNWILSSFELNM